MTWQHSLITLVIAPIAMTFSAWLLPESSGAMMHAMVGWLLVSLVQEALLDLLFKYTWFPHGKGLKVPTSILLGFWLSYSGLNVFEMLLASFGKAPGANIWFTHIWSALMLAGGSATVYDIITKFKSAK